MILSMAERKVRCNLCQDEPAKIQITISDGRILVGRECLDELLRFARIALRGRKRMSGGDKEGHRG